MSDVAGGLVRYCWLLVALEFTWCDAGNELEVLVEMTLVVESDFEGDLRDRFPI